jgi:hypothetical protein
LQKRTKKPLHPGPSLSGKAEAKFAKVFCFFFSKKKALLLRFPDCPAANACTPVVATRRRGSIPRLRSSRRTEGPKA